MNLAIYRGTGIHFDKNEMVSLTDMWKAAGKEVYRQPKEWLKNQDTQNLLKVMEKNSKGGLKPLLKSKPGRYGGTYAVRKLALAYAEYLSPKFHSWALDVIGDRIEEESNPELGIRRARERAIEKWRADGWTEARIDARLAGIDTRKIFTSMLAKHGVRGSGFRNATNGTYMALMGGTAHELRKDLGLSDKANLRDHFNRVELSALQLVEAMASEVIEEESRWGNRSCCTAIVSTGAIVAPVLSKYKRLRA